MSKARDLADYISTGGVLADGQIDPSEINGVTVSSTELNYLSGASSNIQNQLDNISVTSGTLTKTFALNEVATITLSSSITTPVVSVTKEVSQTGVTNNTWDVNSTTGNYTRFNSAPATTLNLVGYAISTASYSSTSLSVAAQDTNPKCVRFNDDGTKLFVLGYTDIDLNEYDLTTAYDISTATYSQNFSLSGQLTTVGGFEFSSDGTKLFVVGFTNDRVYQYNLTTGFDLSTASYSSNSLDVSSQSGVPISMTLNGDGTSLYVLDYAGYTAYQYNMTTAYDITTASYASKSFTVSTQLTTGRDLQFNGDGTKLFVVESAASSKYVYQYSLSTAYDISTASYDSKRFDFSSQDNTQIQGITFNGDGSKLYMVGAGNDAVYEYDLSIDSVSLGTGSFASADVGKTIEANSGVMVLTSTAGAVSVTTAPSSFGQVSSGSWYLYGLKYNTTDGDLEVSSYSDVYNFSSRISLGAQTFYGAVPAATSPTGIYFRPNGARFWTIDNDNDKIMQWDMSPSWSDTTLGYNYQFDVSGQMTAPQDITVPSPGNFIYICDTGGVYRYTLSNGAYTLGSSTNYTQSYTSNAGGHGMDMSHDGTKMFFVSDSTGDIKYHTLSTPYNLTTASFVGNYSPTGISTSGNKAIRFKDNGTRLLILRNNGTMYEWSLSTAYDITNASNITFVGSTAMSLPDSTTNGFDTGDGGKYFYSVGSNARFYISTIGAGVSLPSGYHAALTTTSTDTTYWSDINSMTADEAAGDGEIYYSISTDDRTTWKIADNSNGIRSIVRNNSGTWQYNSNATYASETWTNGTTNDELATIQEAMGTSQNRMNKTQLDAVSDANHFTLANDLDLAIIMTVSSGTLPSSNGVSINYDGNVLNEGAILGTDYDFDTPAATKVRITALAANNLKVRVV